MTLNKKNYPCTELCICSPVKCCLVLQLTRLLLKSKNWRRWKTCWEKSKTWSTAFAVANNPGYFCTINRLMNLTFRVRFHCSLQQLNMFSGIVTLQNWQQKIFCLMIILSQSKLYGVLMCRTYNDEEDGKVVDEQKPGGRRETVDSRSSSRIVCKTIFRCSS